MSDLITYTELTQGTSEWLEARRGIVTASIVGGLITPSLKVANNDTSRALTRQLVAERLTGRIEHKPRTEAMIRGVFDEPLARDHYRQHHAPVEELGFMKRSFGAAWLGYSPDGLVGDDGLIEIKSASPKIHLARILGAPIAHDHMAQMQAGMLVSGRAWCDYISWCGGMPMHVQRVEADDEWQWVITEAVLMFETNAAALTRAYHAATDGLPVTPYIDHFSDDITIGG